MKELKKILILNGSHSEIPLILAAKKQGYYVYTSGNRPDLIGHKYADEYVCCDYSDYKKIYELFKDKELDAVCACANDAGAITASYVAEKLKLPGHDSFETTLTIHHKDRFKKFAETIGLHTPQAYSFENINDALTSVDAIKFPVIVKPIDMTGGKGVSTSSCSEDYCNAVKYAFDVSPSGRIVVEPFVEGTQHSFSTFIVNRKVETYFSDNEYSYLNKYLVSTSGGPAPNTILVKDIIIDDINRMADVLELKDGIVHVQYIFDGKMPHILEITRRCSGDMYPEPVEHSTGIKWAEWIVKAESGMSCSEFPSFRMQNKYCGRHCIMGNKNGFVKEVYISKEIEKNIYDSFVWGKEGYEIQNYMIDKIGILFLEYGSQEEMLEKSERINELIKIIYMDESK